MKVSPWLKRHATVFRTMDEAIEAMRPLIAERWRSVYLAGPIHGCSDVECRAWREAAKARLDHPTIDPMDRDYRGDEEGNEDVIVDGDLASVRRSCAVLANVARPSWGTAMEIRFAAKEMGLPVFAFMEER